MLGPILLGGAALVALLLSTGKKNADGSPASPGAASGGRTSARRSPGLPAIQNASDTALSDAVRTQIAGLLRDLGVGDDGQLTCGSASPQIIQAATTLAAQLESMNAPVAAQQLREYARQAAACIPTPTPAQSVPLPASIPKDLQDQINRALLLEGDPNKLRTIAAGLKTLPQTQEVVNAENLLMAKADQIEAAMATAAALTQTQQILTTSPGIPQVKAPPPAPTAVTVPDVATPLPLPQAKTPAQQLAEAVALMLTRVQANAGTVAKAKGKEDKTLVARFQKGEGLTADGKAGPGTMLALAKYVAMLPWVMYWPTSANAKTVLAYRASLNQLADQASDPMRAAGLRASAQHEHGEAGIVGKMPA